MTIDKAIEFFDGLEGHTPQAKDARNVAIDTMRKYQKIEDIVRDYYNEQYTDKIDIEIIEMISEVLRWED